MSERKHSNSNINDASSNGSEIDDWLDVDVTTSSTTNEERLRNQVRALQRTLDEKNLELVETNVQVDVLKGHKILLENAKSDLQNDLSLQSSQVPRLQEDLGVSNQRIFELEESSHASQSMVQKTEQELNSYQAKTREMQLEIEQLQQLRAEESRRASLKLQDASKNIEELNVNLMAKDETIADRDACMAKLQTDLQSSRDQQLELENKTTSIQKEKDMLKQQVDQFTSDARANAIVAEKLWVDKQSLERKLQQAHNQIEALDDTIATMNQARHQNETKFAQNKQQQQEENQRQEEIKNLSDSLASKKNRELENAKGDVAELAGELVTIRVEADQLQEALNDLRRQHEHFVVEQKHLQEEDAEREEVLLLELAQIKSANTERLEELRQILGVRFHDILVVRSKKATRSVAPAPTAANTSSSKMQKPAGTYIPPPILRTIMGLV